MDLMVELGIHARDAEIADLRAENKRLRDALEKIIGSSQDWSAVAIAWEAIR